MVGYGYVYAGFLTLLALASVKILRMGVAINRVVLLSYCWLDWGMLCVLRFWCMLVYKNVYAAHSRGCIDMCMLHVHVGSTRWPSAVFV